jgi:DNA repair protein RecO (recombination protein O)
LSNVIKTKAIILSSIRWKESSKIVTIYGDQTGKIKIIARSALRSNSSFAGKLESLFLVEVVIDVKDTRSLQVLREIDVINPFSKLRVDLKILPYALALLEIINQVFDESHPDEVFFNFVLEMIQAIIENKNPQNVYIYFLLKLSSYMGFKPVLENCTSGDISLCDEKVFLSISQGTIFCRRCLLESINPISFKKDQFLYLKNLQNVNHRRIKSVDNSRNDFAQIIQCLLKYMNFHLEQNINVEALQLLNS